MHPQVKYWWLALGFFTRLPMPTITDFQESDLNHAARYFPLVGVLVGAVAAMVWWLSAQCLPPNVAVLLSMAATIYLTGAFHEDGLADSADGIGGGLERARMLEIMQDSRLGSYGAIALLGVLLLKFESLTAISTTALPWVLLVGHALSRSMSVGVMASAHYVKFAGKAKPLATRMGRVDLAWAITFGCLPWLTFAGWLVLTSHPWRLAVLWLCLTGASVTVVFVWWRRLLLRNLQGYTGDTLGACQQLTEVAFYLAVLVWETYR